MLADDKKALKELLTKLKKEKVTTSIASEEDEEEEIGEEEGEEEETAEIVVEEEEGASEDLFDQSYLETQHRAKTWARDAALLIGAVPKKKKRESDSEYEKRLEEGAAKLITRVVPPGEFFLVRAGNTRKGTGTFYTPPQLAVPTVHRTLEPLCYDLHPHPTSPVKGEEKGSPPLAGGAGGGGHLIPKKPEEILSLKVCDPSCGSASFLVAALHYLTDALYASLRYHCGIEDREQAKRITLPYGHPRKGKEGENLVPFLPDDEKVGHTFEERIKALLRRHVVERCIYGVDINPLAVEFARVSLWIETLDRELPFTFLDHKIKVGNSLVGCWLDRVLDYPIKAWERNGGDDLTSKVKGPRSLRIETFLKGEFAGKRRTQDGIIKQEMRSVIQQKLFPLGLLKEMGVEEPPSVADTARTDYETLHEMPVNSPEDREAFYREHVQNSESWQRLKRAMDEWCAVWFWPMDEDSAKEVSTPLSFHQPPSTNHQSRLDRVVSEMKFFHWEIEFPDVFTPDRKGFDATLGNPPWEVMKPNSHEFFTQYDPIYRTYDKQAALRKQTDFFTTVPTIQSRWDDYNARFKALSNWVKSAAEAFAISLARGNLGKELADIWEDERKKHEGYANPKHPYQYQGSADLNSFKLFLEVSYSLLSSKGRLGMIVPSGLYTDSGTGDLRELFLEKSSWDWLFSFENRRKIFDIHRSFKFASNIVDRNRNDATLKTAFMVHDLAEWERPNPKVVDFDPSLLDLFSPKSKSIPEVCTERDLDICRKIYEHSIRIGDNAPGWEISYATEFHMTNDSKHFKPRPWWEERGYKPDVFGRWVNAEGDVALPLYEGRMVGQFDFAEKGWVSGTGRSAVWREIPFDDKRIEPQFLMAEETFTSCSDNIVDPKIAYMRIGSATNSRSMIATTIVGFPCEVNASTMRLSAPTFSKTSQFCCALGTLSFDFSLRLRFGGITLNWFIVEECPIPSSFTEGVSQNKLILNACCLSCIHRRFAPEWLSLFRDCPELEQREWKHWWAVTEADRLRLRVEIDALCADLYGLDPDDFDWIVRDDPRDPKGFWRVDKTLPYEERLTGLAANAFRKLKEGKWQAETVGNLSNDEFFDLLGIPELTNLKAAKKKGHDRPLIEKRKGCHSWKPEDFPEDDPRHGWTWEDCYNDAVALLGSEEAVVDYLAEEPKPMEKPAKKKDAREEVEAEQTTLF